jgi:hypothetical protein
MMNEMEERNFYLGHGIQRRKLWRHRRNQISVWKTASVNYTAQEKKAYYILDIYYTFV